MALVFNAIADPASSKDAVRLLYGDAKAAFDRTLAMDGRTDYPSLAWLAGLQAATGRYLGDAALKEEARRTAREAAALDVGHPGVAKLLAGDDSDPAVLAAESTPALP
jgi:hypothetical protein